MGSNEEMEVEEKFDDSFNEDESVSNLNNSSNNLIATPSELILKLSNALAFNKGKVLFTYIIDFISQNLNITVDYLQNNHLYVSYIIGSLMSDSNILLFENGKAIDKKLEFYHQVDVAFLFDSELIKTYKNKEINLSKEKLWEYLTDEKENGESTLGAKTFELLLEIAYHKHDGIDRVALCKNCNQDLRSMPSRLKALEKYTVNVNTITKGRITQIFWHKKFANGALKTDALNTRSAEKSLIMSKLKAASDGIREISDLKEELEIVGDRRKGKRFRLNYFWLDTHQYLKRILVKSENNGKIYFCLKFLKDFSEEDNNVGNDTDDEDDDCFDKNVANNEIATTFAKPITGKQVGNFEFLTSERYSIRTEFADSNFPLLNKVFLNEYVLKSLVENSGVEGLRSMDLCNGLFSTEFIKPFNKFMTYSIKQPNELETELEKTPTQLVKAYDFEGKTKHFRVFTNEAYQQKYGSENPSFVPFYIKNLEENKLNQEKIANDYKIAQSPYWLDYLALENGSVEYFWINSLPTNLKKQVLTLRTKETNKIIKKQKLSKGIHLPTKIEASENIYDLVESKKNVSALKAIKEEPTPTILNQTGLSTKRSARLGSLNTASSILEGSNYAKMERKKFGDLLGHSIRSVKTQQALLSLIGDHNGLLCYFDKYITKDVRIKMNVSYDIDKKVLKRDILNLMEVKKIKSYSFGSQIYLTFPAVTKEQVQYFHDNKLEALKKKVGFEKNVSLKEKFLEQVKSSTILSEGDILVSGNLINDEFITPNTECIIRKELFFQAPNKKKEFERKPVIKVKASDIDLQKHQKVVKKRKQNKLRNLKKERSSGFESLSTTESENLLSKLNPLSKKPRSEQLEFENDHPLMAYLDDNYIQYSYGIEPKVKKGTSLKKTTKKKDLELQEFSTSYEEPLPDSYENSIVQSPGIDIEQVGATSVKPTTINSKKNSKLLRAEKKLFKTNLENFMKFCMLSACLEKEINWTEISRVFTKSSNKLQSAFNDVVEKNGGEEWLKDKKDDCRDFLLSVLKTGALAMDDIENLRYLKIIQLWVQYEKDVVQEPINLLQNVNEFRKKYKLSIQKTDPEFGRNKSILFSEKSYFKTSLVKKYKGLLRNEYYYPVRCNPQFDEAYTNIKCALKSVLLDQIINNDKESKVNIDVISSYIKQYDSVEINNVVKEFSSKKLILLQNNFLQLNGFFVDNFLRLSQIEFFQKYKQSKILVEDSLTGKKCVGMDDELNASLTTFITDKMDRGLLTTITLNGKYKPGLDNDTKYHIKDESILDTALLVLNNGAHENHKTNDDFVLTNIPGLGIPYSRFWIDGNGEVRENIWKVCISYLCHQLYFRPGLNLAFLYTCFKACLDQIEIKELISWLKENKILKYDDTNKYEYIDLDITSTLF